MGRLIDEEELKKYIMHDGCDKGCGYIDERDLKYVLPVEAIPKDQYEARLKADLVAILTEIQLEIEEQVLESLSDGGDDWFTAEKVNECLDIIDKHKAESEKTVEE